MIKYEERFADRVEGERAAPSVPPGRKTLTMQLVPALQRKAASIGARSAPEPCDDAQVAAWPLVVAEEGVAGAGGALPYEAELRASFGRHAGALDGVSAHTDASAAGAARAIGADAYATGSRIAFAATPTRSLVAHEAAHVVQQRAGVSLSGGVGREGDPYEQHADEVGAEFAAGRSVEALLDRFAGSGGGASSVQRKATAGVASDTMYGDDAHFDVAARIQDFQAHGHETRIRLSTGGKRGVRVTMPGYVEKDGAIHELLVTDVAPDHAIARVYAPLSEIEGAATAIVNPAAGVPKRTKTAKALRTRVVSHDVRPEGLRLTLQAGTTRGVEAGMPVVVDGLGTFTIDEVAEHASFAHVQHTLDAAKSHTTAIINP